MRIRIVQDAGNYVAGAELDIDDQVGWELVASGIAVNVIDLTADAPPAPVKEVVKTTRRKK